MTSYSISRLLRRNVSLAQTAGYIIASLFGLSILAVGVRFWTDSSASTRAVSSYIVVQKHVDTSLFGGDPPQFSRTEIAEIEAQPWERRTGRFATADFDVYARVSGMGRSMSTALFLESVPDEFMDVIPDGWDYNPAEGGTVPVVIPKEYLSLYNYGFAPARGLPQISEDMVGIVPVELSLSGRGHQQSLMARIVGFSSRINTIAVPPRFLEWANAEFGRSGGVDASSRLIIETGRPGDPRALKWIEDKGYETITDSASERVVSLASTGSVIVLGIGGVIIALALFILTLSIHLLLYKNRPVLFELMQLGYTPSQVAKPYMKLVGCVNFAVALCALTATWGVRHMWMEPLSNVGLMGGPWWPCLTVTVGTAVLLTLVNCVTIRRMVIKAFRH